MARAIWFCYYNDLNPRGKSIFSAMRSLLNDWYKLNYNEKEADKGWIFNHGEFLNDNGILITIDNLHISGEWIVADTRSSTADSEAFLKDFSNRLSDTFDLPTFDRVGKGKTYASAFYFTPDIPLDFINPKLKDVSDYLSNEVVDKRFEYKIGSLSFWPDQVEANKPIPFSIERTVDVPFSENRYYSKAPLETDKHIALIETFERILKDGSKTKPKRDNNSR